MSLHVNLESSRSCLRHARRRISELRTDVDLYLSMQPYNEAKEVDATTGETVRKVRVTQQPSTEIGHIAFDAISHLRAALDQAAFATALATGYSGRKAYFPFGDSEEDARRQAQNGSKGVPVEIFEVMLSFRPYKTGNLPLWALNKLCNTMKHAVMVYPELRPPRAVKILRGTISGGTVGSKWNLEAMELELERIKPGGTSSLEITYEFQIRLGDEGPVGGLPPAVEYLEDVANLTESILTAIESTGITAK